MLETYTLVQFGHQLRLCAHRGCTTVSLRAMKHSRPTIQIHILLDPVLWFRSCCWLSNNINTIQYNNELGTNSNSWVLFGCVCVINRSQTANWIELFFFPAELHSLIRCQLLIQECDGLVTVCAVWVDVYGWVCEEEWIWTRARWTCDTTTHKDDVDQSCQLSVNETRYKYTPSVSVTITVYRQTSIWSHLTYQRETQRNNRPVITKHPISRCRVVGQFA